MKTLTVLAIIPIVVCALIVSACAPAPIDPNDAAPVYKGMVTIVYTDTKWHYVGDLYKFSVTEFTNSIGEHCTVISGAAVSCTRVDAE